ncbi:regulatory protein RecX [Patescibacteria group bacterium]
MDKLDQRLLSKSLRLLSYRPRSIYEIKQKLKKITPLDKKINKAIDYLIDKNLLNDQQFTKWWVDQRLSFRPKGNIALKQELFQKGIDRQIIEANLLSSSQEKKAAKKLLQLKSKPDQQKAYQYLRTRGFTSQTISSVIDDLPSKE